MSYLQEGENILKCIHSLDYFGTEDRAIIEHLKCSIENRENEDIVGEYYITHKNSWKVLIVFLFFSFASKSSFSSKSISKILKKVNDTAKENITEIAIKKLNMKFDNEDSLAEKAYLEENLIESNRTLLETIEETLENKDYVKFIQNGLNLSPISFENQINDEDQWSFLKPNSNNWLTLLKGSDSYILAIHSNNGSFLNSPLKDQGNLLNRKSKRASSNLKTKEAKLKSERENLFEVVQSSLKDKRAKTFETVDIERPSKELKKAHSESEKDLLIEEKNEENDEITWFETTILVIIFLALACKFGNIFDILLVAFNKYIGSYFLLNGSYHLQSLIWEQN